MCRIRGSREGSLLSAVLRGLSAKMDGRQRTRTGSRANGSEQMGAWPSLQQRLEDVWRAWPPKVIFRDVYL